MADRMYPATTIRLRIPEASYEGIRKELSKAEGGYILLGLCGWTQREGPRGNEVVLCIHTVSDTVLHLNATIWNVPNKWLDGQKGLRNSWQIIFYRPDEEGVVHKHLLKYLTDKLEHFLVVSVTDNGEMIGQSISGNKITPIDSIMISGSDILIWAHGSEDKDPSNREQSKRFEQSFGSKTRRILSRLKIGVVGISGTGSPIAEMLYRLGAGELVLVDNDHVETKNLGRIYNSSIRDAEATRLKVDVIGDAFERNGLPTQVKRIAGTTHESAVVSELAQCDIVFGCMDTESGRAILNRLATFYLIPYFDVGVNLKADGEGGISVVCSAVHYLKPGGSSLISRRAISIENIEAEDLKRINPELYQHRKEEKYIKGVVEERPAVITVNTMIATFAMNDFLARLHPYRRFSNNEIGCIRVDLRELIIHPEPEGEVDKGLAQWVGRGDVNPLLNMTAFG
jgi:hypothetical protein